MPLPPRSQRGRTPNFKEDDAVFAPQAMTLFLKEYKCPLPTTRVTTLEIIKVSPDKNLILQSSTEAKNYSSLLGILLLSREGKELLPS